MLLSLAIRDIVLIEKLDIEWNMALCVLTGETGAGKSILLDALGLAIGARGNTALVRAGAAQGSVIAVFAPASDHPVWTVLAENDIMASPRLTDGLTDEGMADEGMAEIILRRVQMRDGRTRAFCNDIAISAGLLRQIGDELVEIHGQNETQSLTTAVVQLHLLDSYGGLLAQARDVGDAYRAWQVAAHSLATHEERAVAAIQERDFLQYACAEFAELAPQSGEEARLAEECDILRHAEKISGDIDFVIELFSDDDSGAIRSQLSSALIRLERAAIQAGGRLDDASAAISRALIECDEAAIQLRDARESMTSAPARLAEAEERLFALRALARKHQVAADGLDALEVELKARLAAIDDIDDAGAHLNAACAAAEVKWRDVAERLSQARHAAAARLDATVNQELVPLKLTGGSFSTQLTVLTPEAGGVTGLDRVAFVAATNPGTPPAPIAKIASGGELARFMLALKVALERGQSRAHMRTLIFDEVDSGVGGAVAHAVGERLRVLADAGQILVVTHSPQVAALSAHHWLVRKQAVREGNVTDISHLDGTARREEIARMLAGEEITQEARAAAQKLLEDSL